MKKVLSLLLAAALLTSACTSAMAEAGYEAIREAINEACGEGYSYESADLEVGEQVTLVFNLGMGEESGYIILYGRNADDNGEGTIWLMDGLQVLALLAVCCDEWEDKAALVSEDYTLAYMLSMGKDEAGEAQYQVIANAEDAGVMFEIINDIFGLEE